ncbi:hypothetical protein BHM03_00033004 [Ensete ventricosum]|nr:hypothetical protein BHM03_00033004 [Ensete ventricosum]
MDVLSHYTIVPKWAHVTNTFSLTFGTEVVFPTLWVKCFEEEALGKRLWENLDLFEERRAEAHLRTLTYKKVIARLYNQMVRPRHIKSDDLVLRKAEIIAISFLMEILVVLLGFPKLSLQPHHLSMEVGSPLLGVIVLVSLGPVLHLTEVPHEPRALGMLGDLLISRLLDRLLTLGLCTRVHSFSRTDSRAPPWDKAPFKCFQATIFIFFFDGSLHPSAGRFSTTTTIVSSMDVDIGRPIGTWGIPLIRSKFTMPVIRGKVS